VVTGNKSKDKTYYRHSGYPGGLKTVSYEKVLAKKPTFPMEQAIKRMLPRGPLGRKLFTNVKIYAGPSHPHAAQKPEKIEL
jgi:large subunit ribosomal protein L13